MTEWCKRGWDGDGGQLTRSMQPGQPPGVAPIGLDAIARSLGDLDTAGISSSMPVPFAAQREEWWMERLKRCAYGLHGPSMNAASTQIRR